MFTFALPKYCRQALDTQKHPDTLAVFNYTKL